jgi:4-hydroxy-3-methylbut-2-enyl diphosphate reductase
MDAALAVIGVAGALTTGLRPGDLVVADQVHSTRGFWYCPAAPLLAEQLRRTGLTVHVATVLESDRLVGAAGRAALAVDGAVAVDMESARLLELAGGHPAVVLRSIVDTPAHGPMHPATVPAGLRALAALRRAGPGLLAWASDPGGHPTRHDPPAPPTTGDPAGPDHPREVRHR